MLQDVKTVNKHTNLSFSGNLSDEQAKTILKEISGMLSWGLNSFEFDFSRVDHIDNAWFGTLLWIKKMSEQNGGKLKLVGIHGQVKEKFDLTNMNSVLEIQ